MIYDNLKNNSAYQIMVDIARKEIEQEKIYEKFFDIDDGDIVVDIGAHVGIFSKYAMDAASKVYAVEPDPMFIEVLKRIKTDKLSVIPYAISDKEGQSTISSDGNANEIGVGDVEISTISFKQFIEDNDISTIDFLKIDCEGGEYDILTKENMPWIKKNVKKITGELHLHNLRHKSYLMYMLQLFDEYNISCILTSVDGVILSREQVTHNLGYYKEILFYAKTNEGFLPKFVYNYNGGCFVEVIRGYEKYVISLIDKTTGNLEYKNTIGQGNWVKADKSYFIDWLIRIEDTKGNLLVEKHMDLKGKRVHISIDSNSLGDNLAWMPYIEEFRKKHGCSIHCSTAHNDLFQDEYPSITFIKRWSVPENTEATYRISWYYDREILDFNKHPVDTKCQPMQKTASDILGLEYKEIKPRIKLPEVEKEDTVTLGIHATLQAKYWNNPTGWQDVTDYILSKNHKPLLLSREENGHNGNIHPRGIEQLPKSSIHQVIEEICKSKVFIGIGSGLSWLAWACDVPVILVSGFSEGYTEMQDCIRITAPAGSCSGCFNRHKLNANDWNWCPDYKSTNRQFECTKLIESQTVIDNIAKFI